MNARASNWPVWVGFLLSIVALLSYPFLLVRFPITRDVPWVNLLLFAVVAVLTAVGLRRSFRVGSQNSRAGAVVGASLSFLVFAFFVFAIFIFARQLPASQGAPKVGQKAPEFRLADTNGKTVALSELLSSPIGGKAPKGALLVFYRGYW